CTCSKNRSVSVCCPRLRRRARYRSLLSMRSERAMITWSRVRPCERANCKSSFCVTAAPPAPALDQVVLDMPPYAASTPTRPSHHPAHDDHHQAMDTTDSRSEEHTSEL